ncbi:VOC family protein [Saccharopolyspora mangrovi]|uniref:VOC family protein n=1 Tax=Saccharopolyspora mangrovi TaxID=3082379 RepID=A0ABU6ABL7_9PSEU|nr:VOC family protein [Saccharopolyspora sp. S2-29]MEB3368963.1 VOC family protein [Saccharopolyspora sp. S2-29]
MTPYLFVDDAKAALDFYCRVLGATERMRMPMQNGKIAHAEIGIGDSVIMLADEAPEMGARSPKSIGGTPAMLYVYVEDVDRVFDQAVHSGSTVLNSVQNKFYGDRSGEFEDPFGHCWSVATHVEDVSDEEMSRRMTEAMSGG